MNSRSSDRGKTLTSGLSGVQTENRRDVTVNRPCQELYSMSESKIWSSVRHMFRDVKSVRRTGTDR